jgi:rare lipoprotein A
MKAVAVVRPARWQACFDRSKSARRAMSHCTVLALLALLAACAAPPSAPVTLPPPAPAPSLPPAAAPVEQPTFAQSGLASIYGPKQQGHRTASGERLDVHAFTAAHRNLPFYTVVRVTAPSTGKTVKVRINDRGPFIAGRIVDLSQAAAVALGILERGTAPVRIEVYASDQP